MEEMFELFVRNANFPLWIKNLEGIFIFVNQMFADIYNKSKDDIIGHTIEDVVPSNMLEMCNAHQDMVIETGSIVTKEIYTSSGYRQCSIIPLKNDEGKIKYFAGIIGILTEEGKIKEKDREIEIQKMLTEKIIDILPGTIFYKDINGKYVYANKCCREFHIKRGQGSIIGKTDDEINFTKSQQEKFMRDDQIILKTKKTIQNEAIFQNEDGTYTYNEVVKLPLEDNHGNVIGIVGRVLDVTERKLVQKRLEYLSYTDMLTGVKNRACFEVRASELSHIQYFPLGLIMGDANGLKLVNDTLGHLEGDKLLIHIGNIMRDVCADRGEVFRFGGDEFIILLPNTSLKECEALISEINEKCMEYTDEAFNISVSLGSAIKYDDNIDIYTVLQEAEDKVYRKKLLQKKSVKSSILSSLKTGLGVRSGETESHTIRVSDNAIKVGVMLDLEMSQLDELKIAADLHDIGKIGISEDILLKAAPLTTEEFEIIKTHSEKGFRIIKAASELKNVADSVLFHHERWDGKGYPMGLKGEEIPLISRIINVCDAYDVMISERVYTKAISKEEALDEIKRCSGTQFDPKVVKAFVECFYNKDLDII